MSKEYVSTGATLPEDLCDCVTVANYSTTAIAAGSSLIIDATNLDTPQATLAVKTVASANSVARIGIARTTISAAVTIAGVTTPGVGQMAVAGPCRALSASTGFTAGQQVATSATAGLVAVSTTAGAILGSVMKAETTTTPLIMVNLS